MDLAYPELIIFDWDGTLVDTFDLLYEAHNYVRRTMGLVPWTAEEARRYIRASARDIYPEIYGEDFRDALAWLYHYVDDNHLQTLTPMPSAATTLAGLHNELSIPMAVISNKNQFYLEREVAHLGWAHYFQCVVGAGTAEYDKPSAAPVVYLFDKLEQNGLSILDTHSVWLVGDTETDMLCAEAGQITSAFIRNGFGDDSIIEKYKPKVVINDCKNLYDVLQHTIK